MRETIRKLKKYLFLAIIGVTVFIFPNNLRAVYYVPESEILKTQEQDLVSLASLNLSYDDGIQCFVNESLVINVLEEEHGHHYWDRRLNIYKYLKEGENLIACRVSNGDGNPGSASGKFDAQLIVSDEEIIRQSNLDTCSANTYWRFFGKGGSILHPQKDKDGDKWYQFGYDDSSWGYGLAPFGEGSGTRKCTLGILNHAPDDAWFRKKFFLSAEQLGIAPAKPEPKDLYLGAYPQPTLVSVAENKDIKQDPNIIYYTKYHTPIFTGLTQYGSAVKVYIDGNFISYAQVQHGEKSGTANFYYWHKQILPAGLHTVYTISENPLTKFVSSPSVKIYFDIVPIVPPTIISLGENKKVDMTKVYITKWRTPIITGLSPYGKEVKIYIDNQFAGKAVTQEGEKSGTANFYFMPKLTLGRHTTVATSYNPRLDLESIARQVISFEVR